MVIATIVGKQEGSIALIAGAIQERENAETGASGCRRLIHNGRSIQWASIEIDITSAINWFSTPGQSCPIFTQHHRSNHLVSGQGSNLLGIAIHNIGQPYPVASIQELSSGRKNRGYCSVIGIAWCIQGLRRSLPIGRNTIEPILLLIDNRMFIRN